MNPATGPKSTSFKLTIAGLATGVGMIVTDYVQNTNGTQDKVNTAIGGGIAAISIIAKLLHDNGLNKATVEAAAKDAAKVSPEIVGVVQALEADFPVVKEALTGLISRVDKIAKPAEAAFDAAKVAIESQQTNPMTPATGASLS